MRALSLLVSRAPWAVLIVWVLVALLSVPLAARAPAALTADPAGGLEGSEATRALDILRDEFGEKDTNMALLVTRSTPPLTTPEGQARYEAFVDGLEEVPGVTRVISAGSGTVGTQSEDGRMALTVAQILAKANAYAVNGVLWANGLTVGGVAYSNTALRNMGNVVFSGINNAGDI